MIRIKTLYSKYEKTYLSKVIKNQHQHLTEEQSNELIKLLRKSRRLGNCKTDPVDFELK